MYNVNNVICADKDAISKDIPQKFTHSRTKKNQLGKLKRLH